MSRLILQVLTRTSSEVATNLRILLFCKQLYSRFQFPAHREVVFADIARLPQVRGSGQCGNAASSGGFQPCRLGAASC
jgi:hypothetical protein